MLNLNNKINLPKHCPCGSGAGYIDCCQPLHKNKQVAQSAEQLMRSRFSAFALQLHDYLLQTWCDKSRPKSLDLKDQPEWVNLTIWRKEGGELLDQTGQVEFSAFYRLANGKLGEMRELSDFERKANGQWCYKNGVVKDL